LQTDDTKAMFAPLFRLLLSVAFSAIQSKQEIVHEDRYWFMLDEVHQLGDIRIDEALATLRKFGVCIATGLQSDKQVVEKIGESRAAVVMNCFNTVFLLRANEDKMQETSAKRISRMEETVVNRNQALAVTEWRDGAGLNQNDKENWVVMPSEFGYLENCVGYIKTAGDLPGAKVDFRHWLPAWYRWRPRVHRWQPRNKLPQRDPLFLIDAIEADDPFESVRQEAEQAKQKSEAQAEPAATTDLVWVVQPDDEESVVVSTAGRVNSAAGEKPLEDYLS